MASSVSGVALAEIAAGLILAWSGIENVSIQSVVKSFVSGKLPAAGPPVTYATPATATAGTTPATDSGATQAPAAPDSLSANETNARLQAAGYGWTGQQWDALYALWTRESGFNNLIMNEGSGAFGIAQALGHGNAASAEIVPTVYYPGGAEAHNVTVNEYPSAAANAGSATFQIAWGLSYIKTTYGSPEAAWAHETSEGWY